MRHRQMHEAKLSLASHEIFPHEVLPSADPQLRIIYAHIAAALLQVTVYCTQRPTGSRNRHNMCAPFSVFVCLGL